MKTIKVDKIKLIEILTKNMAEHREVFLEAQKKFREVAIERLDAQLKSAREGRPFELHSLALLAAPEDHTKDYQRNIQMLAMSVDEVIEITEQEFQNFVQDVWGWSQRWATSNIGYVSHNSRNYGKLAALTGEDE